VGLMCKDYYHYFISFEIKNEDRNPNKYYYEKIFPPKKYKEIKRMAEPKEVNSDIPELQNSVEKKCWKELDTFFSSISLAHIDRAKLACAALGVLMNEKKLQAFLNIKQLKA